MIGSVLRNKELLRLDFGIFALHAMLTASFLVVPGLLRGTLDVSTRNDWMIYLPVLVVSVAVMVPAIIVAEKYRRMKGVFVAAVAALAGQPGDALFRRAQSLRPAGRARRSSSRASM